MKNPQKLISKMLTGYSSIQPARFHMPGHKGTVNAQDITEISTTDNLNNPSNCILEAQKRLSDYYGTHKSYFLVNGATSGIHAMIKYCSIVKKGKIVFGRNSHRAIINACTLYNIDAIVVEDTFDDELQVFTFSEKAYIDAINIHSNEISAVVLTSIDYYGRVINIDRIKDICNQKGIFLLIDEAHGSHLHASSNLPKSLALYADICVHSPHKTLSAYTQCAFLHTNGKINTDVMQYVIQSVQTSSPNYILVESMDNAITSLLDNPHMWDETAENAKELADRINQLPNIKALDNNFAVSTGFAKKDVSRLVIDVSKIGNGMEIAKYLEENYNIFMEMSNFKYLIGILTPYDNAKWYDLLVDALQGISQNKNHHISIPKMPSTNPISIINSDVIHNSFEQVVLEKAVDRKALMPIGIYPPGVALILPGETITNEIIDYLLLVKNLGGELFGTIEENIYCIKE